MQEIPRIGINKRIWNTMKHHETGKEGTGASNIAGWWFGTAVGPNIPGVRLFVPIGQVRPRVSEPCHVFPWTSRQFPLVVNYMLFADR